MMVAPGVFGARVTSGTKPMKVMRWRMSPTMAFEVIGGSMASYMPIRLASASRFARVISRCSMICACSKGSTVAVVWARSPGICCGSTSMLAELV